MWGVADVQSDAAGHRAFFSEEVEKPQEGELYAGRCEQAIPVLGEADPL
jgi:hypothetical protein